MLRWISDLLSAGFFFTAATLALGLHGLVLNYPLNSFPFFTPPLLLRWCICTSHTKPPPPLPLVPFYVLEIRDNKADVSETYEV